MATSEVAARPKPDSAELIRLRAQLADREREVKELEEEIEKLEVILFTQEFVLIDGYVVAVWPEDDGTFLASCNKLHATVQEATREEALRSVREAMEVVREGMATVGRGLPPRDAA